jgi:hypothetical protein
VVAGLKSSAANEFNLLSKRDMGAAQNGLTIMFYDERLIA